MFLPLAVESVYMSQSPTAAGAVGRFEESSSDLTVRDVEGDVEEVLAALDDADCRAILDATSGEALSASELSEACDLPLSTTYRKIDMLADTGLLEERTRIRQSGKHANEYSRLVEEVLVSVGTDGGLELRVMECDRPDPYGTRLD